MELLFVGYMTRLVMCACVRACVPCMRACVVHSGEVYLQVDAANAATIELRVFVDRSIVTGFVNNGTAAVTTRA